RPARPQRQPRTHAAVGPPQGAVPPWRPGRAGRDRALAGRRLTRARNGEEAGPGGDVGRRPFDPQEGDATMFGLTRLMTARSAPPETVLALSGTVAEVTVALRGRLRLDQADPAPALEHSPDTGNASAAGGRRGKRQSA